MGPGCFAILAAPWLSTPVAPQVYEAEHGVVTDDEIRDAARRARGRAVVVRGGPQEQSPGRGRRGRGAA